MKNQTKRLLSLALAVVMVLAMIPVSAMPAQAEGELTVDAYPRTVAVGQTSKIFTKVDGVVSEELTLTSSNPAVATVEGNVVTGVHSGTATITATDASGATGTYEMVVSATSTYKFNSFSFNIGNDTNDDGIVDDFGGTTYEYTPGKSNTAPIYGENPYTNSADHYIPYYIWGGNGTDGDFGTSISGATAKDGYAYYRGRVGHTYTYPLYTYKIGTEDYTANAKYFNTYDCLNLNNTSPWKWASEYTYIHSGSATFVGNKVLTNNSAAELGVGWPLYDRDVWISIELDVPATGTYKMNVDAGSTGGVNQEYFMVPVSGSLSNTAANMCDMNHYVGNTDLGAGVTKLDASVSLQKGKYFFVINLNWRNTTAATVASMGYIKSVTLTLEEWDDAVVNVDNTGLLVGGTSNISVSQTSSFDKTAVPADLSFEVTGDAIHLLDNEDGSAKVTAIAEGAASVTVSYTEKGQTVTKVIAFNVGTKLNYKFSEKSFNFGNDTNGDGIVDDFGGNTWHDPNNFDVANYIPYKTDGSDRGAGYVWNRSGTGWMLYPFWGTTINKINPTYQNSSTSPWSATRYMAGLGADTGTYMLYDYLNIPYNAYTEGAEPYFTFKLSGVNAGVNDITVDILDYVTKMYFYMIPAAVVESAENVDRALLTDAQYLVGSIDNATTATFRADLAASGDYYFVTKLGNDGVKPSASADGVVYIKSVEICPDVLSAAEIAGAGNKELALGQQVELKVTQTGTISGEQVLNAKFENSNPDAVSVAVVDGVATITAVDAGVANVTVTYTDLFGIERTAVYTYTVTKPVPLTYNFNSFSYKIGVNADDDVYADELGKLTTKPTWYDANDEMFIPAYYRYLGSNGAAYYPSDLKTNGYVYGDLANTGFYWYLSLALSTDSANRNYLYSYDYLDTSATAPFAFTSYSTYSYFLSSANPTAGTHLTQDYLRVNHNGNYPNSVFFDSNGVNNRTYPYITMKIKVAHAGTYTVDLVGGEPSATSANYKVYIAPVNGTTVTDATKDLMKAEYYVGNLDNSVNESGRLQNRVEIPAAGEYYVCFQYAMDGENYNRSTGKMNSLLKSMTLTPVEVDLDTYTVQQDVVLSDDITMKFTVNASGIQIAGFNVKLEDKLLGYVPVETGVNKTISISLIASHMSKIITLEPVDGNGDPVGDARTYSLRQYLLAVIGGNYDATTIELAKNVYNYCAKAQIKANRDVDRIENDNVVVEALNPGEYEGAPIAGSTAGITAKSAALVLDNKVTVRVYFELAADENIKDFTFAYGTKTLEAVKSGNRYYVDVEDINPQQYADDVVIAVTKGEEGNLTVTYSPMDYIQRAYAKESNSPELKNLVQAMYGYYKAAAAYLQAHPQN